MKAHAGSSQEGQPIRFLRACAIHPTTPSDCRRWNVGQKAGVKMGSENSGPKHMETFFGRKRLYGRRIDAKEDGQANKIVLVREAG